MCNYTRNLNLKLFDLYFYFIFIRYIWSKCSANCGVGFRERKRICQIGSNKDSCIGESNEISACYNDICNEPTDNKLPSTPFKNPFAINGKWSEWSAWDSDCQLCKIQSGNLKRKRKCNSPSPSGGGKKCYGVETEFKPCFDSVECSKLFKERAFLKGSTF